MSPISNFSFNSFFFITHCKLDFLINPSSLLLLRMIIFKKFGLISVISAFFQSNVGSKLISSIFFFQFEFANLFAIGPLQPFLWSYFSIPSLRDLIANNWYFTLRGVVMLKPWVYSFWNPYLLFIVLLTSSV